MPPTYGDFDKKQKKIKEKLKKMKIRNTFLKMRLVSTMVNLMFFAMNTRENGLYYGENDSSRFSNRLYYEENDNITTMKKTKLLDNYNFFIIGL